jgi:glycosyltransferase involved in cell wall biosynthesis
VSEQELPAVRIGEPFVSIIIPNFNYGRFLNASIDSALAQTYSNVEVIVVDDGSTDESRDVVATYGNKVRALFKQNGGEGSAVSYGFEQSHGDIIFFLDADDVLYPAAVATVVRSWDRAAAKVQFRLDTIDADGLNLGLEFPHYPAGLTPARVREQALKFGVYTWPVTSGNAYARWYIERVVPLPDCSNQSPDDYLNRIAPLFGDVVTIPVVLGAYRVHGRNRWALTEISGGQIFKYSVALRIDLGMREAFVDIAARHGIQTDGEMMALNISNLETRLLSRRFSPDAHPLQNDRVSGILARGLRSAWIWPNLTVAGRLLWGSWFLALSVLPVGTIKLLVAQMRMQHYRSPLASRLIGLSRKNRLTDATRLETVALRPTTIPELPGPNGAEQRRHGEGASARSASARRR